MPTASATRPTPAVTEADFGDRLPIDPLRDIVDALGGPRCFGDPSDTSTSTLLRSYQRGVAKGRLTVWAADALAVHGLGVGPDTIWGDEWWESFERRERTWPEAIVEVLEVSKVAMTTGEIVEAVRAAGTRRRLGKTPEASVLAAVSTMAASGRWEVVRVGRDRWRFEAASVTDANSSEDRVAS